MPWSNSDISLGVRYMSDSPHPLSAIYAFSPSAPPPFSTVPLTFCGLKYHWRGFSLTFRILTFWESLRTI